MPEHVIRLNNVMQTSASTDGTVTIAQGRDLYVLEFATDEHAFDLIDNISSARMWKHQAETSRMEAAR